MAYINLGQVIYPVGAIYQSWNSTSPATLFGGQWIQITEKFLYCSNSAGGTGGASAVTLNINQVPSHKHDVLYASHSTVEELRICQSNATGGSSWQMAAATNTNGRRIYTDTKGGGGNLTRICHPISDATLGDAPLNLFIGGGLVWHM